MWKYYIQMNIPLFFFSFFPIHGLLFQIFYFHSCLSLMSPSLFFVPHVSQMQSLHSLVSLLLTYVRVSCTLPAGSRFFLTMWLSSPSSHVHQHHYNTLFFEASTRLSISWIAPFPFHPSLLLPSSTSAFAPLHIQFLYLATIYHG